MTTTTQGLAEEIQKSPIAHVFVEYGESAETLQKACETVSYLAEMYKSQNISVGIICDDEMIRRILAAKGVSKKSLVKSTDITVTSLVLVRRVFITIGEISKKAQTLLTASHSIHEKKFIQFFDSPKADHGKFYIS